LGPGREVQKQRARELIEAGRTPSVTDVADAAGISRHTYRYFPTRSNCLRKRRSNDCAIARVWSAEDALDRLVMEVQRLAIAAALGRSEVGGAAGRNSARRPGRGVDLISAVAVRIGIEAVTVLLDICGLTDRKSIEVTRWTPRAILHAVVRR
jgi:hypothetical protein